MFAAFNLTASPLRVAVLGMNQPSLAKKEPRGLYSPSHCELFFTAAPLAGALLAAPLCATEVLPTAGRHFNTLKTWPTGSSALLQPLLQLVYKPAWAAEPSAPLVTPPKVQSLQTPSSGPLHSHRCCGPTFTFPHQIRCHILHNFA